METVLRIVFLYFFLLIMLRCLGKRELAELSPFELTLIMLIPEISSQALTREDYSMTNAVIGLSTMFTLVLGSSILAYRFRKVRDITEGKPVVVVRHGKIIADHLDKERVSIDDIVAEMRGAGIEKFTDLKWVIVETDGKISVVPYDQNQMNQNDSDKIVL